MKSAAKVRLEISTLRSLPEGCHGRSDPEHWTSLFSRRPSERPVFRVSSLVQVKHANCRLLRTASLEVENDSRRVPQSIDADWGNGCWTAGVHYRNALSLVI